jgi:hypothetical protein
MRAEHTFSSVSGPYGVSLDSRQSTNTKSGTPSSLVYFSSSLTLAFSTTDWMMFTAGAFNNVNKDTSTKLAGLVYNYAVATNASAPFPDSYNINNALEAQSFTAR